MKKINLGLNLPLKAVGETETHMLIIKDAKDNYFFFKKDGTYDEKDIVVDSENVMIIKHYLNLEGT